jgi:hypothetical protein
MITEGQIKQTVSKAEELFQDCWAKLSDMKNAETFFSFQPTLACLLARQFHRPFVVKVVSHGNPPPRSWPKSCLPSGR